MSEALLLLAELPGEVLHTVCTFLDDEDLLNFGFICRYVHQVAHPVYLARHGVGHHDDGTLGFADLRSEGVVKAVRSSLSSLNFHRLLVPFHLGHSTANGGSQPRVFGTSIKAGLDRIACSNEVYIKLAYPPGSGNGGREGSRDLLANRRAIHNWDARGLRTEWDWFMDRYLSRSQCRVLHVEGEVERGGLAEPIEQGIWGNYYGLSSINRVRFHLPNPALAPFRWLGVLPSPKLEHFDVHAEFLFHPTLCHWTLCILNSPSLTSVSFDQLSYMSESSWNLLLPLINIPNLTKLSINHCRIATHDLYCFLARHPNIEDLSFGFNLPRLLPTTPLPKSALSKLRSLTAPIEHLVVLLSISTHPLPTLKTVRVLYRTRRVTLFLSNAINSDLAPICFRLRSVSEVILSVILESAATDWLVMVRSGSQGPRYELPEHLRDDEEGSRSSSTSRAGLTSSITFTGTCVTHLEVKVKQYVLPHSLVLVLPKWVRAFEKTKCFDLVSLSSSSGWGIGGRKCAMGAEDPFELDSHRESFLRALVKNCPTLKRIKVNGEDEEVPSGRAASVIALV
ncbi:hypothetical protein CC1G_06097 [Coprinopsis cinerea okayama7|uniref:F-box domain-containing protein n=1 Tax=Coprinopsis cinerea (strain Okayama-7 / 130 / ATCC MYA-4618 / FGSC 9003) TaxID=240176 RepID=A8PA55_COPC7|nr:hypothetical protein CC1G_06097 [Coprinopsis cinerea okayama7\|eukprot:XP_001839907.1 hypothetical protein CC1G_06097 [Coprinopsis cinerea okayama7\